MPSDYYFGYYFYAPNGRFEACGMFTFCHIIATLLCIISVALALIYFKNKLNNSKTKIIRITAVVLTVLETVKIAHSFIYNELNLDAWFPLSYCGLFIFASWMAGFGKSYIKRAGEVFISYGCPIAGAAFLIFPTTSLMSFPIWHFFSLYSMFFHSLMIFMGILFLRSEKRLDRSAFLCYAGYVTVFAAIAVVMNNVFNCNLMNLREPYNIPIDFLQDLFDSFPAGYTTLVFIAYLIIPFVVGVFSKKIKKN